MRLSWVKEEILRVPTNVGGALAGEAIKVRVLGSIHVC